MYRIYVDIYFDWIFMQEFRGIDHNNARAQLTRFSQSYCVYDFVFLSSQGRLKEERGKRGHFIPGLILEKF